MGPLFGLSYGWLLVLGGALVLAILLFVAISQRRKKASAAAQVKATPTPKHGAAKHPTKGGKAARYAQLKQAAEAAPAYPPSGPQNAYASAMPQGAPQLPPMPLPQANYAAPQAPPTLPSVPAPRVHSVPIEHIIPGADPLQAMIIEILNGWGELTQEDTNRLTVFRADRIMAAIASAEIPKDLKANEHARARLSQLRRWAAGLEHSAARREAAAQTAQHEYAGIAAVVAPAPAPFSPAPPAMPFFGEQAAPAAAFAAVATPLVAPAGPSALAASAPQYLNSGPGAMLGQRALQEATQTPMPPAAAPARPAAPAPAPIEVVPIAAPAPMPVEAAPAAPREPWQTEMAEANRSTEAAIAAAAAAFWARPELGGQVPDAVQAVPQTPPLAPPIPQPVQGSPIGAAQPALQNPGFFPLGQDLPALAVPTPNIQAPAVAPAAAPTQRSPFSGPASDDFLQGLAGRVTTAEDLLALPPAEQPGMLAFLKPSELARVIQSTPDPELKRSVIDTLGEHR